MPDILAMGRPFEVVEAVVRPVAVFVVDLILALAPGQVEGLRDEDVDEVVFAVDHDGTVAVFVGSGGFDDALGVLEASEGGDHRVLVRLPDFDGFGHFGVGVLKAAPRIFLSRKTRSNFGLKKVVTSQNISK